MLVDPEKLVKSNIETILNEFNRGYIEHSVSIENDTYALINLKYNDIMYQLKFNASVFSRDYKDITGTAKLNLIGYADRAINKYYERESLQN